VWCGKTPWEMRHFFKIIIGADRWVWCRPEHPGGGQQNPQFGVASGRARPNSAGMLTRNTNGLLTPALRGSRHGRGAFRLLRVPRRARRDF